MALRTSHSELGRTRSSRDAASLVIAALAAIGLLAGGVRPGSVAGIVTTPHPDRAAGPANPAPQGDAAGSGPAPAAVPDRVVPPAPVSNPPAVDSLRTIRRTNWIVPLAVRCPPAKRCRGRIKLITKATSQQTGAITDVVLGTKTYDIAKGQARTVQITLNQRGQTLLATQVLLKVRIRLVRAAGSGVATVSRTSITLRAPGTA
jgi:hypothetical protein